MIALPALSATSAAWVSTIGSVAAVSAVPVFVALALPRDEVRLRRIVRWLVGFAVGALLGAAFLHLIPESLSSSTRSSAPSLVLAGFFAFFVLERYLWTHQHDLTDTSTRRLPPLAALNVIGDGAHNFVDGMVIAAAYLTDRSLGATTTLAVLLHEVPQEIGDFAILVHSGLSWRRAVAWNLISALTAFAGAVGVMVVGPHMAGLVGALVPIAAGGFIYIGASDLIPELKSDTAPGRTISLLLPIAIGILLTSLPSLIAHD